MSADSFYSALKCSGVDCLILIVIVNGVARLQNGNKIEKKQTEGLPSQQSGLERHFCIRNFQTRKTSELKPRRRLRW